MSDKIAKLNVQEIFELNMVQKGMLYYYLKEADHNLYNCQLSFSITGDLDVKALQSAFTLVQSNNEVLRSVFRWELVSKPLQIILRDCPVDFSFNDLSQKSPAEIADLVQQYSEADQNDRFDLSRLPVKLRVIKTAHHTFVLNITNHHILYDGWSNGLLLQEFFTNYNYLAKNKVPVTPRKPAYKELHIGTQKNADPVAEAKFWESYLKGFETQPHFPGNMQHAKAGQQVKKLHIVTSITELDDFAKRHRTTKASVIYAAYGILLQQYSAASDIVFGSTVSNRNPAIHGSDHIIGNFINTIPLRMQFPDDASLLEVLGQVNTGIAERTAFHRTSLYEIKQILGLQTKDILYDSVVGIENYPLNEELINSCEGLDIKLNAVYENTHASLVVLAFFRDQLEIEFNYKQSVLSDEFVQAIAGQFITIIREILGYPDKKLSAIDILSEADKHKILHEFNDTKTAIPHNMTIVDLFEDQVAAAPGAVAVVYKNTITTYAALSVRANQLANTLNDRGIVPGDIVALMAEPSVEMIVGILGILKAGAGYLPVNPEFPAARISAMYVDAGCTILLTQQQLAEKLPGTVTPIFLDDPASYSDNITAPEVRITPDTLLYTIYTSGTTGIPKGVMIKHSNLVNYVCWLRDFIGITGRDKTVLVTSFAFDLGYTSLFSSILSGAGLHLLPKEIYTTPGSLLEYIAANDISYIKMTPSLFATLVEHPDFAMIRSIRTLILGGEKIRAEDLEKTLAVAPCIRMINHYGPTETTIGSIARYINNVELAGFKTRPTIGKPIQNTWCYILDRAKRLVPVGGKGELYIGGAGVGNGYLGKEELTKEKFIENPFISGGRLYRTGDIARWLQDGNIEFLGRVDHQVKIRGYRVELGEIESWLSGHAQLQEVLVLAKSTNSDTQLVAYYVAREPVDISELREYLAAGLPEYMVPAFFVHLPAMPLTANGKVDRKALPEPTVATQETQYRASTEMEQMLTEIWAQVLGHQDISTNRSFFEIGGDSLKLILVTSKIAKKLKRKVQITELFNYPTIRELAVFLTADKTREALSANKSETVAINLENETNETHYRETDIAIIGMAARFPGAKNVEVFWQNLAAGAETIFRRIDGDENPTIYAKGLLEECEMFEASFFNYTPEEAHLMDPQMRVFHECVWEALEDAGYNPYKYAGSIGLYGGASHNPFYSATISAGSRDQWMDQWQAYIYSTKDFLCPRVSYKLNLRGPSVNISTACSTSLVAIDAGCRDLLSEKCDIAVAGGVSLTFHDNDGYKYKRDMILSPDGYCRAFDKNAAGTVGGNGVGIIVLKKLSHALRDGDNIHAVIKGSATNNDGMQKVGFTAPGIEGQAAVIKAALHNAGVESESVSYIETHGTGTLLGDPVEFKGLKAAFSSDKRRICAIGSVKTNIGHLNAASGVAGIIKTVLSLKHKQIPPSLHFHEANPALEIEDSPFYVNSTLTNWARNGHPRRAGISSFGIGGTNAHVIVEEAPEQKTTIQGREYQLIVLSAKTRAALERNIENLKKYLGTDERQQLADIAYTLNMGRAPFDYRRSIVCRNRNEAIELLSVTGKGQATGPIRNNEGQAIVFMFSGQGSQYHNMLREVYEHEPYFRDCVDQCFTIVKNLTGKDLHSIVFAVNDSPEKNEIGNTEFTQPLLFIMEYALARLLMHWGIQPTIMIGHSIGEYSAACISGVFSLEDALMLVVKRGELMQQLPGGSMLSIAISEEKLETLIANRQNISLAAVNSSQSCVVSGNDESIQEFKAVIEAEGYRCKQVNCSHAFHSHMMDDILEAFEQVVHSIPIHSPRISFISNLTGQPAGAADIARPAYWVDHLRRTVRFADGISNTMSNPKVVFIEVGPGNVLSSFVRSHTQKAAGHVVINVARHPQDNENDWRYILSALGDIFRQGIEPDWRAFYEGEKRKKVSLPAYSFEKIKYPVNALPAGIGIQAEGSLSRHKNIGNWFYIPAWKVGPLIVNRNNSLDICCELIFADDWGVSAALAEKIRQHNDRVICVHPGDGFKENSPTSYTINPAVKEDYTQLLERLSAYGSLPDRIIHAWTVDRNQQSPFSMPAFLESCTLYFFSLINTIDAMHRRRGALRQIVLLTNELHPITGKEQPCLAKSACAGLLKIISQEYPAISVSHIDISLPENIHQSFVSGLLAEIRSNETGKTVALRNGRRWLQIFDRVYSEKMDSRLRSNGVYLITGGLGDLGYSIAKYLAKHFHARIVLTGRTVLPDTTAWNDFIQQPGSSESIKKSIQRILQIEKDGAEVYYRSCDVSDTPGMAAVLAEAEKRFGPVNGVVHAAGIIRGQSKGPISGLTKNEYAYQFSAKVGGLHTLHEIFGNRELDFCIVASSLSTILGGLGFAAYTSANIYMDYLLNAFRAKPALNNWVSVNFDGLNLQDKPEDGINSAEIDEVFVRILSLLNVPQVAVSVADLDKRLNKWIRRELVIQETKSETPAYEQTYKVDTTPVSDANTNTGTETILVKLWVQFFGNPEITTYDDFFAIGGDSLKALTMIGRINKAFRIELSVSELFNHSTIQELGKHIDEICCELNKAGITQAASKVSIPKTTARPYYPLSSVQKRLYFLHEFDKSSIAYNMPLVVTLRGEPDTTRLTSVFRQLIGRHENLRTSFEIIHEEPVQKIAEHCSFDIEYYEPGDSVDQVIQQFIRPFDLKTAPLVRVGLIQIQSNEYILMVDLHHIITDAVSKNLLIKDFIALYNKEELQALPLQYTDYAVWQQSKEQLEAMEEQKDFWVKDFIEEATILELPTDFHRPLVKNYNGHSLKFEIGTAETAKLQSIAEAAGTTMFMVLLSIYNILLSKLSSQEDIIIGTSLAGRPHADLEKIMGMFVNTLPLRNYVPGNISFREFLATVKAKTLSCFDNQLYPYEALIDALKVERNTGRNPLFDTEFSFENFDQSAIELPGLTIKPYRFNHQSSKFDITLTAFESKQQLFLQFEYSTELFKEATIVRYITYFKKIVSVVTDDVNRRISMINILTEKERDQLLYTFNNTERIFPQDRLFIELFQEQAAKTPGSVAVMQGNQQMTYQQLNEKANQLAGYLTEHIQAGSCVPVVMEPCPALLISMLGIFKAGMVYVPVNVAMPLARITHNIADVDATILITKHEYINDSIEFYSGIAAATGVHTIVMYDDASPESNELHLFRTFRAAVQAIRQGKSAVTDAVFYDGKQMFPAEEVHKRIAQLIHLLAAEANEPAQLFGIVLANPVYTIIAIQSLQQLHYPFRVLLPDQEINTASLEGITALISENACNARTDMLFWESKTIQLCILLDDYDSRFSKKEEAFKKIWNYKAEETSAAVNDYGWSSSYTGQPFSVQEMAEYVANFSEKLRGHLHSGSRVLEIGCGHGIVLFELAPKVGYYHATDLAENILEKNKERLDAAGIGHVGLEACPAIDIHTVREKDFDIIICSSAVHYFPDTVYLEKCIQHAITLMKGNGIIYLDDLLNLAEKENLVKSVIQYKTSNPESHAKTDWNNDLFVGENFFAFLFDKYPAIAAVDISRKTGIIDNELTRYRYDVLLTIDKNAGGRRVRTMGKKRRFSYEDIAAKGGLAGIVPVTQNGYSAPAATDIISVTGLQTYPVNDPAIKNSVEDLSYIIYTSGSTGRPKGAMIQHLGMLNHLFAKINDLSLTDADVIAQTAPASFDISIWQFLAGLLTGARTYIISKDILLEPRQLINELEKGGVTVFESVPSLLTTFLDGIDNGNKNLLPQLRWMIPTGETLSPALAGKWYACFPGIRLLNAYGPTEASDDITHHIVAPSQQEDANIPIGRPVQNMQIFITDKYLNVCGVGIKGEICVAGLGVGRGYWKDEEKTAKAFIPNPFMDDDTRPGYGQLYKTGDIGYFLEDGNIVCLGRADEQVKIRGYRIELGEIVSQLSQYTNIRESVVVTREKNGEKYLVAFYVTEKEIAIEPEVVKKYLSGRLPDYMVPAYYIQLNEMPLTPNGKLDKKALPPVSVDKEGNYMAPSNAIEKKLLDTWSDVLKLEKDLISVNRSFFDLGGHSLKATVLVNKIFRDFNVRIPLREIFNHQDIKSLGKLIRDIEQTQYASIRKTGIKEYYALSPAQQRLYFLYEFDRASLAYNMPHVVKLEGLLDKERLTHVFKALINRHESLRTSFRLINYEPVQVISEEPDFAIAQFCAKEHETEAIIRAFIQPFNLERAPLIRVGIIEISTTEHILVTDMHHIITDGISQNILTSDFMSLYNNHPLPPLALQYKDFAEWQRSGNQQPEMVRQQAFWLQEFAEEVSVLQLPLDHNRPPVKSFEGSSIHFKIDAVETAKLRSIAETEGATLFMVLLSAYAILVSKLSNQEDVVIGIPIAGRQHADLDSMIGMFVNTLPVRNYPKGEMEFAAFLSAVKMKALSAFDNQGYPYEELIGQLNIERDTAHNPLFDIMFVFQNFEGAALTIPGLALRPYHSEHIISKFDLTLTVVESGYELLLNMEYCTKLFKQETIERFIVYFRKIIAAITENIRCKISGINILHNEEQYQLLYGYNNTETNYPHHETVVSLFDRQATMFPEKTALLFGDGSVSYGELKELSEQIAAYLQTKKGIRPGGFVGIMLDRDEYLAPSILGILKAGAAYIPIDPAYPAARAHSIIDDSLLQVLITTGKHLPAINDIHIAVIDLEKDLALIRSCAEKSAAIRPDSNSIAYIIYTSGSTGTPKGVMISHRSLLNYINWAAARYISGDNVCFALYTSISFDLTVTSVFTPLITGNPIAVYGEENNAFLVMKVIEDKTANIIKCTPSHLKLIRESELMKDYHNDRRITFIVGGEDLDTRLAKDIYHLFGGNIDIYNEYGPTEATVGCMIYKYDPEDTFSSVPIGKPAANTQLFIVDKYMRPVATGVNGELCISGDGLAKGYLSAENLTAEKFIDHPFMENKKMYRTGDLACRLPSGNILFKGRIDEQVKIRGFRIEPGEIESRLKLHRDIQDAVVQVKDKNGDKYLVAWYVSAREMEDSYIRNYLADKIPDYMIPLYYVRLDSLPLTPNGKLDKKALPDAAARAGNDHVAASGEAEEKLVEIWSAILGIDKDSISTRQSFFELGGNSLKMVRLHSMIKQQLQWQVTIPELFRYSTISLLTRYIRYGDEEEEKYKSEAKEEVLGMQSALHILMEG